MDRTNPPLEFMRMRLFPSENISLYNRMNTLLEEWQERLNLQGWDIAFQICSRDDMETDGEAEVKVRTSVQRALIRILSPEEYRKHEEHPDLFPQDMERSLVHELLHIQMIGFADPESGSTEDLLLENHIENMSKVLVGLKRERSQIYGREASSIILNEAGGGSSGEEHQPDAEEPGSAGCEEKPAAEA